MTIALVSKTYTPDGNWLLKGARQLRLPPITHRRCSMLDIIMLTLGLGFFVASIGYAYACERL